MPLLYPIGVRDVSYSLRITGVDELRSKLKPALFRASLERGLSAVVHELKGEVQRRTPVKTGRLRSSITAHVSGMRGAISSNANYARFVEEGTRPHTITARRARALAWPGVAARTSSGLGRGPRGTRSGTGRGGFIYARSVRHPGTTGRHMFRNAITETRDRLNRIFRAEIQRWIASH